MGKSAFDFIDFLKKAGQTYWQILPINPPGYGDSPYQAFSTFAGNPYLIDLDQLVQNGWLKQEELDRVSWGSREDQVDFSTMYDQRRMCCIWPGAASTRPRRTATPNISSSRSRGSMSTCSLWPSKHIITTARGHSGRSISRMHQPEAMARYREQLRDEIDFQSFLQFCFHTQWQRLRAYAHENGIQIIAISPSTSRWTPPTSGRTPRTSS